MYFFALTSNNASTVKPLSHFLIQFNKIEIKTGKLKLKVRLNKSNEHAYVGVVHVHGTKSRLHMLHQVSL